MTLFSCCFLLMYSYEYSYYEYIVVLTFPSIILKAFTTSRTTMTGRGAEM
jgi:hypothetical protein